MKKTGTIILAVLLISVPLLAGTNGGYSGAFLRIGLGARAMGMGNANVAVAKGAWALYYNPGAMPWNTDRELALSTRSLSLDRDYHFVGVAVPLRPPNAPVQAGLALGWIHAGVTDIDGRDFDGNRYGWLEQHEHAFQMAFGVGDTTKFGVGLAVKVIYSLFPDMTEEEAAVSANGVGMDLGVRVTPLPFLVIAARVKDFNLLSSDRRMKITWDTTDFWSQGSSKADRFPVQFVGGVMVTPMDGLTVACDLETSSTYDRRVHVGAEYATTFSDKLSGAVRAGVDYHNITFGIGITPKIWELQATLDYAYIVETVSPLDTHVISWTFRL